MSRLATELRDGQLVASPGVLVAVGLDDAVTVVVTPSQARPEGPACAGVEDLLAAGLVRDAADRPDLRSRFVHDWSQGWPPDAGAVVLPGLGSALLLPAATTGLARKVLAQRYLASLPAPLAKALLAAVTGRALIVSQAWTTALEAVLDAPPPTEGDAFLADEDAGWRACSTTRPFGPLSTAPAARELAAAGQHIVAGSVLPSPASIGMPPMSFAGVRSSRREARVVAAAEATERHAAGLIDHADLTVGSYDRLPAATSPNEHLAFAAWQYREHRDLAEFDPAGERVWVRTRRAGEPERRWLELADLVFYPLGSGRRVHAYANSSGVAAHVNDELAEAAAWAELVERDAFCRHWLARRPGRRVRAARLPEEYRAMEHDLTDAGWAVTLLQLGEDPTLPVLCALVEKHDMVVLGAGAGAASAAATTALREAWASIRVTQERESVPEPDAVRSPSDHRRLYRWGGFAHEVRFLREGDATVQLDELASLPSLPADASTYVWPAHWTRPLVVARVLCPSLIPITFGYQREPLGRRDVQALLAARGADGRDMVPHPFP